MCRSFYDDLYQTQLSGCSAFPESRLQSLPHPYSPLRANIFLRISRNRVQASNPHLNKSFWKKMSSNRNCTRSTSHLFSFLSSIKMWLVEPSNRKLDSIRCLPTEVVHSRVLVVLFFWVSKNNVIGRTRFDQMSSNEVVHGLNLILFGLISNLNVTVVGHN